MRIRLLWMAVVALALTIAADSRPLGAQQTYPELLGGPDSPSAPTKSGSGAPRAAPAAREPGKADISSKPWRAIDVDNPEPAKPAGKRSVRKAKPRLRQAPVPKREKVVIERPARKPPPAARCPEPRYRVDVQRVLVEPERVVERTRPARFAIVRERVEVRPAQEGYLVYPAHYRTVRETVLVRPAQRRVVRVPAQYREELRRVTVTGPRSGWVRERVGGHYRWVPATLPPATRVQLVSVPVAPAHAALIEEPAVYETRTQRVLVRPERRERVTVEGEYRTVTRKVLVELARRERVVVPARYDTLTRRVPATSRARASGPSEDCR